MAPARQRQVTPEATFSGPCGDLTAAVSRAYSDCARPPLTLAAPPIFSMPSVEVIPVESRRDRRQFFNLPWDLYRGDPNWIPPIRIVQKELLNFRPHPFYDDGGDSQFPRPSRRQASRPHRGDRQPRSQPLVPRAAWLLRLLRVDRRRGRFGRPVRRRPPVVRQPRASKPIRGPVNPSLNYEVGLLIDGFDDPPWFMMTYNKPYYSAADRGVRLSQGAGHVRLLGPPRHARGGHPAAVLAQPHRARAVSIALPADGRQEVSTRRSRPSSKSTTARSSTPGASCPCRTARSKSRPPA